MKIETSNNTLNRPPQLRAKRARKQKILRWIVLSIVLIFFLFPLFSMFIFSIRFPLSGKWTMQAWQTIAAGPSAQGNQSMAVLWQGLFASIGLAIFTVLAMLILLVPTMLVLRLRAPKLTRIVEFISLLPLTIPAIVLVVGYAPIYRFIATYIFNTDAIWLGFAYVILVLPFAYRALDAGFNAISVKTLVEAARSLGASWFRVVFGVIVPNLRQAILSACFISVAVVLGEYTIAQLLNRTNLQVGLFLVGQNDPMVSTAMSLLALVFAMALLLILGVFVGKKKGNK